jgi:hypothetical protein
MASAPAARLDVGPALAVPIERRVFGNRRVTFGNGDSAAVHEPEQDGFGRDIEHRPQTLDVGREQRRRIAQPCPGVDDAVIHHVAVRHGCAQRFFVEKASIAAFDVQIADRHCRAGLAEEHPHVVTSLDELSGDMRSNEPAGTHHEGSTSAGRWRGHFFLRSRACAKSRKLSACRPQTRTVALGGFLLRRR